MRLLLFLLLLGLAMFSNPKFSQHQEAVRTEIRNQANAKTQDNLASKLGQLINRGASQLAIETLMTYDNYYLASLTRIKTETQDQVLSLGLFGQVWVLPNELTF
jgi:hypothetical protein